LSAAPPQRLPGCALSKREREIAMLVAQGLTSRQMAERLTMTERNINTHLERCPWPCECINGWRMYKRMNVITGGQEME
jgi:FixJ family two-component response regulator